MINVQIIYQWRSALLLKRLFDPMERLHKDRKLNVSIFDVSQYQLENISKADVIILSNIIDKDSDSIVSEAKQRGTGLIYDSCVNKDDSIRIIGDFFEALSRDIRAVNIRDRLIKMVDMVTSKDGSVVLEHRHAEEKHRQINNGNKQDWYDAVMSLSSLDKSPVTMSSGKRILFISPTLMWPHHYISDVLVRNLMDMGHEVHLFTPKPSRFHSEAICLPGNFDERFMKRLSAYSEDVWKIPPLIVREEPDLVITVQGYTLPRQVLKEIKRTGVPSAVWLMDEPYDASRSCAIGSYFTHVFLQDRASIAYHRRYGNPNSFYLPHGCDPYGIHLPSSGNNGYTRDVAIVGTPFPERVELVYGLKKMGVNVDVVGNGWNELKAGHNVRSLSLSEASKYYRSTKININLHRNEDDYSTNPGMFTAKSPNCSTFYIAGSGAFQLVDKDREGLKEYFTPENEIATFSDIRDCAEKIVYYLENEEERQQIASASYERACREHTYMERLKTMLRIVDEEEAIHFDEGHRRTGYVQICGESMKGQEDLCRKNYIVLLVDKDYESSVPNPVKVLKMKAEEGFSQALNRALFESSADYIIIGGSELLNAHLEIEEFLRNFNEDLRLGLIVFQGPGDEVSGLLMPSRVLMEAGIFRFGNATLSVNDMCYRLEEIGMVVKKVPFDAPMIEDSAFSLASSEKDKNEFEIEWTENPEARLRAWRLVKLTDEHRRRISKPDSLSMFKKSLEICPEFLKGHRLLGKMLLEDGKTNEARVHFEKIWDKNPEDVNSALLYSITLCLTGKADIADSVLDHIVKSNSEYLDKASAYYQKGLIQKSKKDFNAAKRNFNLALGDDPNHIRSMKELGMLALEAGNPEEALRIYMSMLSINNNDEVMTDDEVMNDIGAIHWTTGNKTEAYEWFVKALKSNPANKNTVINIATAGAELGRSEDVREYVKKSLNYHPRDRELIGLLK